MVIDQDSDSQRLVSPEDGAGEGPEQAQIRPASFNSDASNQLISPHNNDVSINYIGVSDFEESYENEP